MESDYNVIFVTQNRTTIHFKTKFDKFSKI